MSTPPSFDYSAVRALLVDIDDTVVRFKPGVPTDSLFGALRQAAVRLGGLTPAEAERRIEEVKKQERWWHWSDFIVALDVNPKEFWRYAVELERKNLEPTGPEIGRALRRLHKAGYRLYATSNNPSSGILYKLSIVGLATIQGAPLFDQLLGATELHAMKWEPGYWKKVLAHTGLDAGEVAIVGDDPRDDLEVPHSIGIAHTFLINRHDDLSERDSERVTHVRGFDRVAECLLASAPLPQGKAPAVYAAA